MENSTQTVAKTETSVEKNHLNSLGCCPDSPIGELIGIRRLFLFLMMRSIGGSAGEIVSFRTDLDGVSACAS